MKNDKKKVLTKSGLHALVWQEEDLFVAQALEVDIASQGKTKSEALKNLQEAVDLYFSEEEVSLPKSPSRFYLEKIFPRISYA